MLKHMSKFAISLLTKSSSLLFLILLCTYVTTTTGSSRFRAAPSKYKWNFKSMTEESKISLCYNNFSGEKLSTCLKLFDDKKVDQFTLKYFHLNTMQQNRSLIENIHGVFVECFIAFRLDTFSSHKLSGLKECLSERIEFDGQDGNGIEKYKTTKSIVRLAKQVESIFKQWTQTNKDKKVYFEDKVVLKNLFSISESFQYELIDLPQFYAEYRTDDNLDNLRKEIFGKLHDEQRNKPWDIDPSHEIKKYQDRDTAAFEKVYKELHEKLNICAAESDTFAYNDCIAAIGENLKINSLKIIDEFRSDADRKNTFDYIFENEGLKILNVLNRFVKANVVSGEGQDHGHEVSSHQNRDNMKVLNIEATICECYNTTKKNTSAMETCLKRQIKHAEFIKRFEEHHRLMLESAGKNEDPQDEKFLEAKQSAQQNYDIVNTCFQEYLDEGSNLNVLKACYNENFVIKEELSFKGIQYFKNIAMKINSIHEFYTWTPQKDKEKIYDEEGKLVVTLKQDEFLKKVKYHLIDLPSFYSEYERTLDMAALRAAIVKTLLDCGEKRWNIDVSREIEDFKKERHSSLVSECKSILKAITGCQSTSSTACYQEKADDFDKEAIADASSKDKRVCSVIMQKVNSGVNKSNLFRHIIGPLTLSAKLSDYIALLEEYIKIKEPSSTAGDNSSASSTANKSKSSSPSKKSEESSSLAIIGIVVVVLICVSGTMIAGYFMFYKKVKQNPEELN